MKKYLSTSIKMTLVMIFVCCVFYFNIVALIGEAAAGRGGGEKIMVNGKVVGYKLLGQKFTADKYFWGRPSAVEYNSAGSGGSNKGPSNPDYLKVVQERIDTFLLHNPSVKREEIPAEMVTASGSGLDPHISPAAAAVQIKRIANVRGISEGKIRLLVDQHTDRPIAGLPGISKINVLQLNIALDQLQK